jgi:hypothetical protein
LLLKFLSFLSWLNCQDYPGTVVLSWNNCHACFFMAVLSTAVDPLTAFQTWLFTRTKTVPGCAGCSHRGCLVTEIQLWLSFSSGMYSVHAAWLSWFGWPSMVFLSYCSCPGCPPMAVLQRSSSHNCFVVNFPSQLSCPVYRKKVLFMVVRSHCKSKINNNSCW